MVSGHTCSPIFGQCSPIFHLIHCQVSLSRTTVPYILQVIICSSVDSGWIPKVFVLLSYFYLYLLVLFPKFSGPNEVFYSCCFTCSSVHYTLGNMDKNAHWEERACSDSLAARDQSWSFRNSHPFSSRAPPPISSSLCHWRVSELGPGTDSGK